MMYEIWWRDADTGAVEIHYEVFMLREDTEIKAEELSIIYGEDYEIKKAEYF